MYTELAEIPVPTGAQFISNHGQWRIQPGPGSEHLVTMI